jgi:murein DD-endopeptidase MepM/ murein hydrolase activator NlpD
MQDRTSFSVWQKKLDKSLSDVRQKGRERLTIMIIPHGHEQIISLHLNWYLVIFLLGLLLGSSVFTTFLVYTENKKSRERQRMEEAYGKYFQKSMATGNQIRNLFGRIKEQKENLAALTEMQSLDAQELADFISEENILPAFNLEISQQLSLERKKDPGFQYIAAIEKLKLARHYMAAHLIAAEEQPLFQIKPAVIRSFPFGRPVEMNGTVRDTSAYGLRMNPWGGAAFDFHTGYDITSSHGTMILATASGTVKTAAYTGSGYGNYVVVDHGYEIYSLYAHMSRLFVKKGDAVTRGMQLGQMGSSGNSTGVHLHYEIMFGEEHRIDPLPFICALDETSAICKPFRT